METIYKLAKERHVENLGLEAQSKASVDGFGTRKFRK